jgi:hypothetical protein
VHGASGALSGVTATSHALGSALSIKTSAIEHIKWRGYEIGEARSPVHVALGALSGVTTTSRALARAASSTAGSLSGRPASCRLLRPLGARSQLGPWLG